jgi:hypothetical protein
MALAAMTNRLIPVVFRDHYLCSYAEHALKVDAHTSRDKLLNEAEDMESSFAWKELEAERAKRVSMLPKNVNALLLWLLDQEAQLTASLFAFCVAASVDGISAADRADPINALADLMQVEMPYYWSPTRASYLDHVSKARIIDEVSNAVSPEAAADLQSMKKGDAAAELRLSGRGWLPEVLTNRETPKVHSYGIDDDEAVDEEAATGQTMRQTMWRHATKANLSTLVDISQLTIFPQSATGRQADSVRDQFARDLAETRAARNDATRSEFQKIKATLDAYRLLAALSHSLERERDDAVHRQDRDELPARTSKPDALGVSEQQRGATIQNPTRTSPSTPSLDR